MERKTLISIFMLGFIRLKQAFAIKLCILSLLFFFKLLNLVY